MGWLLIQEGPSDVEESQQALPASAATKTAVKAAPLSLGSPFFRVLAFTFAGSMAVNISRFGSSLAMQSADFPAAAVSSAAMVSGLVAIPITLTIGTLSDRLGSKHFLFASYLFGLSGALILTGASALWQFWAASVLNMLAFSVSGAMSQALTSEVVPASSLGQGLSWLNTLSAAASIACFAVGGVLFERLGLPAVFLLTALVALLASTAVEWLLPSRRSQAAVEECA
jgi:MFS family permease